MSLTIELKRRLRNRKDKYLEFYKGEKLKLPTRELEELLFDYDEMLGIKKIGFYSHNISKLDLSDLSFDDVNLDNEFFSEEIIDLSNTNAHIDFSKTPQYKKGGIIRISNINLKNVDLSNNDLDILSKSGNNYIKNCNLSNTGIIITSDTRIDFTNCDLSHNIFKLSRPLVIDPNFSCYDSDLILYTERDDIYSFINSFRYCNLSYTGAKIKSTYNLLKYQLNNLENNSNLRECTIEPSKRRIPDKKFVLRNLNI